MPESAHAPLQSSQTIALIESSPLNSASWEKLAEKVRSQNDPLSIKSLEIIVAGLKRVEAMNEQAEKNKTPPPRLSGLSQSMFVRLAKAYNSPTLLKEIGLIYLRDLGLPDIALQYFQRSLFLGGPEKELRPLTEAAAVAVQRQIARANNREPAHSGITEAQHARPVATTIIRKTGKMLIPARFTQTSATKLSTVSAEMATPLPATTADCLSEAAAAIKAGSLKRAQVLLLKANKEPGSAPDMWQAWTNLGQAYYEDAQYIEVEAAFLQALKYDSSEMASHFNLALGYHLNQKYDLAIASYSRANELEPDHPKVWCNLGVLYFQLDSYEQAETALRHAVGADRKYARAWDNLAASLGAQDKLDEAIEACLQAIGLRPDYPEAYFKLGVIYFSRNKLEEAAAEFTRASVLPPLTAYCDTFLAMVHARQAQPEVAEADVEQAVKADAQCDLLWMAWNDIGLAWYSEKNFHRAAHAYGEATKLKPDEPEAWFNLGVCHHCAGELKSARESYQRAVDLKESLAGAWHNLGIVCAESDDLAAAVAAFQREVHWSPSNVRAWYDLGVTYEKWGRHDDARAAFAKAEALEATALSSSCEARDAEVPEKSLPAATAAPLSAPPEIKLPEKAPLLSP